jgi:hypothetical protein
MDRPHTIGVSSVTQYHLSVSGGSNVTLSSQSPTADNFFDAGSSTAASSDNIWSLGPNTSRQNLIGYSLDGKNRNITRSINGAYTTPAIDFNNFHQLIFNSIAQFSVSFSFTDVSGSKIIPPTSLSINVKGGVQNVPGFTAWLDNGTSFAIASLLWEGADVKPSNGTNYQVSGPLSPSVHTRIYNLKMDVTDFLGLPISGAKVGIKLANGTTLSASTASDGMVTLPQIPLGSLSANVSYLGQSTQTLGDASTQTVTTARMTLSYPTIGVIGGAVAAFVLVATILKLRRRVKKPEIS